MVNHLINEKIKFHIPFTNSVYKEGLKMAKYIIKHTSIMHNGKLYAEGSPINLKEDDAIRLADFIEPVIETPPHSNQTQSPPVNNQNSDNAAVDESKKNNRNNGD